MSQVVKLAQCIRIIVLAERKQPHPPSIVDCTHIVSYSGSSVAFTVYHLEAFSLVEQDVEANQ